MTKKILVVDDEMDVLDYVRQILEGKGYQVTTVSSDKVALNQLMADKYDLLLTDLAINGSELDGVSLMDIVSGTSPQSPIKAKKFFGERLEGYREFKERYKGVPMILMTRKLSESNIMSVKMLGGSDAIRKNLNYPPFSKSELVEKIEKYLKE